MNRKPFGKYGAINISAVKYWLLTSPRSGHRVNPAAADAPEPIGWRGLAALRRVFLRHFLV
jgi:hypothetical protein